MPVSTVQVPKSDAGFASKSEADRLVATAQELRGLFRSEAPEAEKLRTPTPEVGKLLKDTGLLNMMPPRRLGGLGLSFTDYGRVLMEVGKGDTSVSWVVQIINGTTWVASLASDTVQEALFGQGVTPICGAYNPPGTARRVDGGWIVNGAWPYMSGSRQAVWGQCGVLLEGHEGPVVPGINMAYIPMADLEMRNTWYSVGMQATGSDTGVAKDVFVPDERMVLMDKPYGYRWPGARHFGAPSDYVPVVPAIRATGLAQLVGAARAMLEIVIEESPSKPIVTTTYKNRAQSGAYVTEIGRVATQLDVAETLLFSALGILDDVSLSGREFPLAERVRHKGSCAQIVEMIHDSIESLMFISGSSAFGLDKQLCRFWRDIHVGMRHVQMIPMLGYEIYGRDLMNLENITPAPAI